MTCFHPLIGYKALQADAVTRKRKVVFNPMKALNSAGGFRLPCGQCRGCRADRAQQWAVRCQHEAQMHAASCFVTLTFSDEHLPADFSIRKRHLQLFMMKIRKHHGSGVRFFGVGEYGDENGRPHYHVLLFGLDFSADRTKWAKRDGFQTWRSATLERHWPFGQSEIGTVTPESAGYVARYCVKKITGELAREHYLRPSPVDGLMHRVEPEFALMSRKPGLGTSWFERFRSDAFPSDFLIVNGRPTKPPMFYYRKLEKEADAVRPAPGRELRGYRLREASGSALPAVKIKRARKAFSVQPRQKANGTKARLAVREEVFTSRVSRLKRDRA